MNERKYKEDFGCHINPLIVAIVDRAIRSPDHPEHLGDGIDGMTLVDLVEMFADWCAVGIRNGGNGEEDAILKTMRETLFKKYGVNDQLAQIILNTYMEYFFMGKAVRK